MNRQMNVDSLLRSTSHHQVLTLSLSVCFLLISLPVRARPHGHCAHHAHLQICRTSSLNHCDECSAVLCEDLDRRIGHRVHRGRLQISLTSYLSPVHDHALVLRRTPELTAAKP